jgi:serine/threonine-protein kinase RsbW
MLKYTQENGCNIVALTVPAKIECRDMVLRTVSAACKLVMPHARVRGSYQSELTHHLVSAVSEAYNNIVLHGYAGREPGSIEVHFESCREWMRIMIKDTGISFDPSQAIPPDLDSLPESGLGVFIMRSLVDEMTYEAGETNVLTLLKRLDETSATDINIPLPGAKMGR